MAFCPNCGAQIPDGSKFCTNCGTKMAEAPAAPQAPVQSYTPPAQETYAAPAPVYNAPVQETYSAPQESAYTQPFQPSYSAPQEPAYTAPEQYNSYAPQQPYSAPQEPAYSQPVQPSYAAPQEPAYTAPEQYNPYAPQQPYSAPVQQYSAPQAAPAGKAKKAGGKKVGLIVGIVAVIAALVVCGVLFIPKLLGDNGEGDPNLGIYEATYAEMLGYEMEVDEVFDGEFTVELKKNGKCTIVVGEDKANGKWTLDGDDFSFTGGGLDCSGTLKDGVMELENVLDMGVQLKLYKDGEVPDAAAVIPVADPTDAPDDIDNGNTEPDAPVDNPVDTPVEPAVEANPYADYAGKYIGYSLGYNGSLVAVTEIGYNCLDFILNEDGTMTLTNGEDSDPGFYTISGETFEANVSEDGETFLLTGTIKDGVICIPNFLDLGFDFTLYKEGVTPVGELVSLNEALGISDDPDAGLTEVQSFWNGDWYGWWIMTDSGGGYAGMDGDWWDVCAQITVNPDGSAQIILWDEDCDEETAMSVVDLTINPDGTSSYGTAISESGWFYDMDVAHADWIIDPGLMSYDQMIWIDGYYENADGDYYTYDMYLRPWGYIWDDVEEADLPYYYNDWYLPLVQAGEPMPLAIG